MRETEVAFEATTPLDFDRAVARCREALSDEGFGVLTEIDIQAKLKEKLGVETERHLILGACHPPSAHRALEARPDIGVLLPCNVTVAVEGGDVVVRAMRPAAVLGLVREPALEEVGEEVGAALERVVRAVEAG